MNKSEALKYLNKTIKGKKCEWMCGSYLKGEHVVVFVNAILPVESKPDAEFTTIRYDMIGAHPEFHPQAAVEAMGMYIMDAIPFPISDCWIFRVANAPQHPPKYIEVLENFDWDKFVD